MNWDQLEGGWKQRRGRAVHQWGKIMNDELTKMAGKYEELVGKLQEKYGNARETTVRQQNDFAKIVSQLRQANARLMALLAKINEVNPVRRKKAIAKRPKSARRSTTRRT
jgi:uncharacterized protein YjbJ (UPF0337 family)